MVKTTMLARPATFARPPLPGHLCPSTFARPATFARPRDFAAESTLETLGRPSQHWHSSLLEFLTTLIYKKNQPKGREVAELAVIGSEPWQ